MLKYFLILQLFCWTGFINAQNIKKYIQENSVQIKSIEPDSTNYTDLELIGNAIGSAKIVMLGEQDHGDAPTFLAKTRLIKYLHEKKGFNIIAFESDFFSLNEGWSSIEKNKIVIDSFLKSNILSLWSYCNECNELLYNYIPSTLITKTPLEVTGFDNQMVYSYSRNYLVSKLDSVLNKYNLPITKQPNYKSDVLGIINNLVTKFWYKRPPDSSFEKCNGVLQQIKKQFQDYKIPVNSFWYFIIENLITFNNETIVTTKFITKQTETNNIRDRQMYLNLKWLVEEKYSNEKIIVWGANLHIAKESAYDKNYNTMGEFLSTDSVLTKSIYSIGFTSFSGEGGRLYSKRYSIPDAPKNSFEGWLAPFSTYSFTDFIRYNKQYPFYNQPFDMRGWFYKFTNANWNKIFDGVFFINNMYSCN